MDQRGWSTRDLSRELAQTQSAVVKALALLELPAQVQEQVEQGALSPTTAYEVSKIEDPAEQAEVAAQIVAESLTREPAGELVRSRSGRASKPAGRKGKGGPVVFRTAVGLTVTVARTRGKAAVSDAEILSALAEIRSRIEGAAATDQSA